MVVGKVCLVCEVTHRRYLLLRIATLSCEPDQSTVTKTQSLGDSSCDRFCWLLQSR